MNREDIRKLLGGYATGTLTLEEQEALFAAALEDQELFDALAREQSLRDLLRDPAAKAQALAALDQPKQGWLTRWWRPAALAAASVAVAGLVFIAVRPKPRIENTQLIATVREQPAAPAVPQPEAATPPAATARAKSAATQPATDEEKRVSSALRREAAPKPAAKEVDSVLSDAVSPATPPGVGGVVGGIPGSVPLALPSAAPAPPPPPPVKRESPVFATQNAAQSVDIQGLKSKAVELSARELFMQNIAFTNQLFSKDGSPQSVQQGQQVAPSAQQQGGFRQQAAGNKSGFGGAQDIRTLASAGSVGVRYTILPGADTPSVRFEPNAVGHLSVWARLPSGAWRVVQSSSASVLMPITVKLAAGEKEIAVWFSRDPGSRVPQEPPPAIGPAAVQPEGPRAGDPATYAVNSNLAANEVRFNITLN